MPRTLGSVRKTRSALLEPEPTFEVVNVGAAGAKGAVLEDFLVQRHVGADAVGMSTAPELFVASRLGMRAIGISLISNMAAGILPKKISHAEVLETGEMVRGTLVKLLKALLP